MPEAVRLVLGILLAAPTVYLVLVCGYLGLLGLGAWLFRKPSGGPGEKLPTFALLIPAHNESTQIEDTVRGALAMDYPREAFTVFVIADNCTDDTAAKARAAGAVVTERHDPSLRGKGQALDWCLHNHAETLGAFDCIALVDADMFIDARFLAEMALSFQSLKVQVVQSLNTVSNPEASWRSAFGYMGFTTINFTRPAGRRWLGGTAELRGSGMAFRAPLLLRYGWPAHSLAEDVEFSKRLLLDGVLIDLNPDAKVTSGIPLHASQANVQQQRWEGGKIQIVKQYLPLMLRHAVARPSIAAIDATLDLLVPPQSVLFGLLALTFVGATLVSPEWGALILLCGAAVAFCIATGLLLQRAPLKVWLYLLALPVFLAWKIPLYAGLLLRKGGGQAWQRTPRDSEIGKGSGR
jgi:cellulose synthase/poly-beta-1,6-N-acetylglucosamine synthase-like glycosyltransferase